MLCSLRMIHRDDAGIPTAAPNIIRVAIRDSDVRRLHGSEGWARLTYIAPQRGSVYRIAGPHDGVDELVKAGQRGPQHVEAGSRVPSLKVPWKGYQY